MAGFGPTKAAADTTPSSASTANGCSAPSKSNNFLAVVDTATDRVISEVGPVGGGIHPFAVTADGARCFLNTGRSGVGFEVGDVQTGKIIHQVKVPGLESQKRLCHGIGLSPDEKEIWLNDQGQVHVFDVTGPAPRFVETIKLTAPGHGWTTFSIDGRFGYPDSGDVFAAAATRRSRKLTDASGKGVASSKMIEVHFQAGKVVRVGDQFGVGRRTSVATPGLLTAAERTHYTATSRHAEVVGYCRDLAKASPLVRVAELGTSREGRKLPLVILADPPVATSAEAAKSGKLVVLAMGNIHAGEVDGKEALLMLMRDLALDGDRSLLKHLVLLFVPNFNADGGDRMAKTNRPWQNGPPEVGIRANAQGFDLNRDYVKLESPEVRALVRLFNEWDPAIVIDTHTTNGSYHNFAITYDGPRHPACDSRVVDFTRDSLLPDVGARLKKHGGQLSSFYGNFAQGKTLWETYPAEPRYGTQYVGLRNRIGILCESYVYASYRERVLASRDFVRSCFENAAANRDALRKLLKDAAQPRSKIALRHRPVALKKPITIAGIESGKTAPPGKVKGFVVTYLGKCEPTREVTRPHAYIIPAEYKTAIETLRRHGITATPLQRETMAAVEVYRIGKVTTAGRPFQGHRLVTVAAKARSERRKLPAGSIVVRTDQPLGALATFLLEPESEDGLCTWNCFDAGLREGSDYPVLRLRGNGDGRITP